MQKADFITQGGASVNEALLLDGIQGFSGTYGSLAANLAEREASAYEEFVSTYGQYFGKAKISRKAVAGSKGREDAFLRQVAEIMDSSVASFGMIAGRKILGPDGGYIGTATGNTAGTGTAGDPGFSTTATTIVLDDPSDAVNFAKDQLVQFSATTKGGSTLNSGGTLKVGSVDVSNGIITFVGNTGVGDATYAAAEGVADGPATVYIFRNGDYVTGADAGVNIRPLGDWNPLTAVVGTTDTYNGVDRGQDERLSGCRLTAAEAAGLSVKERIETLINKMRNTAGAMDTDYVSVNGKVWMELSHDVQQYGWTTFGKVMEIGAGEIVIMTPNGAVRVINEPNIPASLIRVLTSKSFKIYNYNGFPGMPNEDGLKMLRDGANYSVEWEAYSCLTVAGRPWDFGVAPSGVN